MHIMTYHCIARHVVASMSTSFKQLHHVAFGLSCQGARRVCVCLLHRLCSVFLWFFLFPWRTRTRVFFRFCSHQEVGKNNWRKMLRLFSSVHASCPSAMLSHVSLNTHRRNMNSAQCQYPQCLAMCHWRHTGDIWMVLKARSAAEMQQRMQFQFTALLVLYAMISCDDTM